MKDQAKAPVIVVAVIALVGVLYFFGARAFTAGDLDQGQVKYTPGKPPWADPLKAKPKTDANSPGGMGAPSLGNGAH